MNPPAGGVPVNRRRRPSAPVVIGGLGGSGVAPLVIWLAGQFGLDLPPEVAGCIGSLIGAAIGYVTRAGRIA